MASGDDHGANAALARTVDALMQCSLLVNENITTECAVQRIMDEAKSLIGAEAASVFLMGRERKELYSTVNSTGGELRIPASAGVAGHVVTTGKALVVADAYSDPRFNRSVDDKTGLKTRDILCAPLRVRSGPTVGVVQLINKTDSPPAARSADLEGREEPERPRTFTGDDLELLQVFASQVAATMGNGWSPESKRTCRGDDSPQFDPPPRQRRPDGGNGADVVEGAEDLSAEVEEVLKGALSTWEADTLELARLTDRKPLSTLGMRIFDTEGLVERFQLDRPKLVRFFLEIEAGYDDSVPYHNRAHAASVLQMMYALLIHGGVAEAVRREGDGQLEMMACLIAAAVHDFEHRGLSNVFLVQTGDERAIRWNDRQSNENHHIAATFDVLRRPECNFLAELPAAEYRRFRALIIDLVLATDMADGNRLLKILTDSLEKSGIDVSTAGQAVEGVEPMTFRPSSDAEVTSALQIALKCADVGHLALSPEAHSTWVDLLQTEFFVQGDQEKELKFPEISFLMDRDKPGVTETQVGFFDFVALPLFRALVAAFPKAAPMLSAVMVNHEFWRDLAAARESKAKRGTI